MTFCDKLQNSLNYRIAVYNLEGSLQEGYELGFWYTDDISHKNSVTYVRVKNTIIAVEGELSEDSCSLIKVIYELSEEKVSSDFVQPLEYIIKNDIDNENIKGKYIGFNVLYIKSNVDIKDIIGGIYEGFSYETVGDGEGVYLVKQMEDVEQEAESIISGISDESGIDVIVGSGRKVAGNYTVKDAAQHAKTAASLAQILCFREGFYHIDKMIMYGMINSIDKEKIDFYINGGYSGFADVVRDRELIETAEELFRCHLNISEAARRLYLHRNTLLYRIEKIKNLTDIDIKKFEEAVIFRIIISIYKLKGM